jgi:hypothetical protein
MKPIMLFRQDRETYDEIKIAKKYFDVYERRNMIPDNSLVIGRYSLLPYYKELEDDLKDKTCKLLDTYSQFNWVANFEYYNDLQKYTFKTWFSPSEIPKDSGPLVVKGTTNSKKMYWSNKMFAKNREIAIDIACELRSDNLIGQQDIIFRQYEPLVTYEIGLNGLPFTNEWRLFYYKGKLLSKGYYWSTADEPERGKITDDALKMSQEIADIAKEHCNFYVLDIAEKQSGGWVLVEINYGGQSGLSLNDPDIMYENLAKELNIT